jgi:hypothetical protein
MQQATNCDAPCATGGPDACNITQNANKGCERAIQPAPTGGSDARDRLNISLHKHDSRTFLSWYDDADKRALINPTFRGEPPSKPTFIIADLQALMGYCQLATINAMAVTTLQQQLDASQPDAADAAEQQQKHAELQQKHAEALERAAAAEQRATTAELELTQARQELAVLRVAPSRAEARCQAEQERRRSEAAAAETIAGLRLELQTALEAQQQLESTVRSLQFKRTVEYSKYQYQ